MIRLSSLLGKRVVTQGGRRLGHVEDVQVDQDGAVSMLALGGSGWIEREGGKGGAKLVSWRRVVAVSAREVVVQDLASPAWPRHPA